MKKKTGSSEEKVRTLLEEAAEAAKIAARRGEPDNSKGNHGKGSKSEGLAPSDARRLKQLEEENRRLRSLVADLTLSNQALKLAVSKKW